MLRRDENMTDENLIKRLAKDISNAEKVIALTGAGISTESGIPDFRGPKGLWKKYDPEQSTYTFFRRDTKRFWELQIQMEEDGFDLSKAKPNPAHLALAKLEELGYLSCVITQNVDGLHQKAGNTDVIEFHGNSNRAICIECKRRYPMSEVKSRVKSGELPPLCEYCGGILKPDAVLFEEPIPTEALRRAQDEAASCSLMLIIGTSSTVHPAAGLPSIAKSYGAAVVEINAEPTPLTGTISDYIIEGKVGKTLPKIVEEVERLEKL